MPPPAVMKHCGKEREEETRWPESVFPKSQVTDDKSQSSPQNACPNTQVNNTPNLMSWSSPLLCHKFGENLLRCKFSEKILKE